MAFFECVGKTQADLDAAYTNGYNAGKVDGQSALKAVTIYFRAYRPQGAHSGSSIVTCNGQTLFNIGCGTGYGEPTDSTWAKTIYV